MDNFKKVMKEIIVEQNSKIKELKDEIDTLNSLIKEYRIILNKYELPGLLMDAVGRKLLIDLVEEEGEIIK